MQPLVSIVLASYNGASHIQEQLLSLLNQTYKNIEIIVCDDCSQDETIDIVRRIKENDNRISIYVNEKNIGLNKNFEQGCNMAKGAYIAICDQDDIWVPEKIENMISLFLDDSILLSHSCSIRFTDHPPRQISSYNKRNLFKGNDVRKLFYFNTIAGHNIVFRRELLNFAIPFPKQTFYDWWLVMIAAVHGKVNASDKVLAYHRFHEHNVTLGKKDEKFQNLSKATERWLAVEVFLKIKEMKKNDMDFGAELLHHLSALKKNKFSLGLFLFLVKNSKTVFYFKKSFFSRIKTSYRLSWAK